MIHFQILLFINQTQINFIILDLIFIFIFINLILIVIN